MIIDLYGNSKNTTNDTLATQQAEQAAKAEQAYQGAQAYLRAMAEQYKQDHQDTDWAGVDEVLSS